MASEIQVDTQFYVTEIEVEGTTEDLVSEQTIAEVSYTGSDTELIDSVAATVEVSVVNDEPVVDVISEATITYRTDSITVDGTAGTILSGHRVVANLPSLGYADSSDPTFGRCALYLTTGAMTTGSTAPVLSEGLITEPSWTWTSGATLYLGTSGFLTQTAPTTGISRVIGWAETATMIYFDPQIAVFLV